MIKEMSCRNYGCIASNYIGKCISTVGPESPTKFEGYTCSFDVIHSTQSSGFFILL